MTPTHAASPPTPQDRPVRIVDAFPRQRLRLPQTARLDDMRAVCVEWVRCFQTYRVFRFNSERLSLLSSLLCPPDGRGLTREELILAIRAYRDHCDRDDWHRRNPGAVKTFERFLGGGDLERWIDAGVRLAERARMDAERAERERAEREFVARVQHLVRRFEAMPRNEQHRRIRDAVAAIDRPDRPILGSMTFANPRVRHEVLRRLAAEQAASGADTDSLTPATPLQSAAGCPIPRPAAAGTETKE